MDAGLRERLLEDVGALRPGGLECFLAVRDPVRVAGEHVPQVRVVEARDARDAARQGSEPGRWPYG